MITSLLHITLFFSKDWKNTQFLHIFQEQLVTGRRYGTGDHNKEGANTMEAFVDLRY